MVFRVRARIAPVAAAFAVALLAATTPARAELPESSEETPRALSTEDRLTYTTAFDALRRGQFEEARAAARRANDRVLLGQVEFERLFHRDYTASYDELAAWLQEYGDLPSAPRVYNLAMRRRPDGAEEPRRPGGVLARTWDSLRAATTGLDADQVHSRAARIAYNSDDLTEAYRLGAEIGDWWTAGLAAYRQNDFNAAFEAFERVAVDPTEDPWVRAGAGVWAAKSATQAGRNDRVTEFLRLAARWPATFYGQVALAQLGEEPTISNAGPRPYMSGGQAELTQASYTPGQAGGIQRAELETFVREDARARRTVALAEVGRRDDAREELRRGLRTSTGPAQRLWVALASAMGSRISGVPNDSAVATIDAQRYPVPDLQPEGGFTIERALVYAIARKESQFNPSARSSVGAYGLMQVMPATAAELAGDRSFASNPNRLLQPATNMRLGQAYINRMLQMNAFDGDLLRAVASYNAGPGPMLGALRKLGPDADPLLLIETIDVPQARQYVEEVVAAYWIYQRMFGGPLNTLNAVAGGERRIPVALDYVAPPPIPSVTDQAPVEIAAVPQTAGGH